MTKSIFGKYLALVESLMRNDPKVAVWVGKLRFPKGGVELWRRRKPVGAMIDQCAAELASGERFFDLRLDGDTLQVTSWDWRADYESLERPFCEAVEVAAKVGATGKLTKVARFEHGECSWVTYSLRGKKCNIGEGDAGFDSPNMQKVLAEAGPSFRAWLDAHPEAKVRFERAGKYGYIDRTGFERIAPTLDRAYEFSDGIANIQLGHRGRLLTRAGKLLPYDYFLTGYFLRGRAPVAVEQDVYGYVDGKGKLRIPAEFTRAEAFRGPLAIVTTKANVRRWITSQGKLVGDPIEYTHGFTEDLAWIYSYADKCYRCIDATAARAFDAEFYATAPFVGGFAAVVVKEGGKWGYCDRSGRMVIAPRFDEAQPFSEGRAAVKIDKKYRLIDERGKLLGEAFDGIHAPMSEGLIAVTRKGRVGFADKRGEIVLSPKFEIAHGFFEDRACAMVDKRWGHIDREGRWVVPAELEDTNRYRDGLAPAKSRGLYGFIDRDGAWVVPPRYEAAQPMFTDGLAWVKLP